MGMKTRWADSAQVGATTIQD